MTIYDIAEDVGSYYRSAANWLAKDPPPPYVCRRLPGGGSTHFYALLDVFPRVRRHRRGGIQGEGLAALVARDAACRAAAGDGGGTPPNADLGSDLDGLAERAAIFRAALDGDERRRLRDIENIAATRIREWLWGDRAAAAVVDAVRDILPCHPAIIRRVLGDEASREFPHDAARQRVWCLYFATAHLPANIFAE